MTIGDISTRTGVPASTIRYWERIGVLPKADRSGGQRRYHEAAIDSIAVVRLTQACGFSLADTGRLLHGFRPGVAASERWRRLAERRRKELDEQIQSLHRMRRVLDHVIECRCVDLAECGRLTSITGNPIDANH